MSHASRSRSVTRGSFAIANDAESGVNGHTHTIKLFQAPSTAISIPMIGTELSNQHVMLVYSYGGNSK